MNTSTSNTITFETIQQAILWEIEITGQISDGQWENARPYDHYKPWCSAAVIVSDGSQPLGRDFYVPRDSYALTSTELLDCIGDRMLMYLALTNRNPEAAAKLLASSYAWMPESLDEYNHYIERSGQSLGEHYSRYLARFHNAGFTIEDVIDARHDIVTGVVTRKHLKAVLNDIKQIMKIWRTQHSPAVYTLVQPAVKRVRTKRSSVVAPTVVDLANRIRTEYFTAKSFKDLDFDELVDFAIAAKTIYPTQYHDIINYVAKEAGLELR